MAVRRRGRTTHLTALSRTISNTQRPDRFTPSALTPLWRSLGLQPSISATLLPSQASESSFGMGDSWLLFFGAFRQNRQTESYFNILLHMFIAIPDLLILDFIY